MIGTYIKDIADRAEWAGRYEGKADMAREVATLLRTIGHDRLADSYDNTADTYERDGQRERNSLNGWRWLAQKECIRLSDHQSREVERLLESARSHAPQLREAAE